MPFTSWRQNETVDYFKIQQSFLRKVGTRHLCIFVVRDFWATWWVPADIGSSFTSGFFLCCPLMCLMCCSFYFQKLKLKADSRSLFWFPTEYCTKCPLSYQNEKTENVHLESWLSVYMFQSSLMADNLTRPRMKYFWAKSDRAQTCCNSHSVLWTHHQPAVVNTAIFEVLLAFYAYSWYSTCNARSHAPASSHYIPSYGPVHLCRWAY
jgi:hypothetical protein